MNRSYRKGYNFERRVKKHLERAGYFVIRSGKSSFPDLVALKGNLIIFVECKVNGRLSKREIKKAREIMDKVDCCFFVAFRDKKRVVFRPLRESEWKNI